MSTTASESLSLGITPIVKRSYHRSRRKQNKRTHKQENTNRKNVIPTRRVHESNPFALVGYFNTITSTIAVTQKDKTL